MSSPSEAIISLTLADFSIPTGAYNSIKIGNVVTEAQGAPISNWLTLKLGQLTIDEYYGAYLDYLPTTQCRLYLPHFGFVSIALDYVINCTIEVTYYIDLYSGGCVIEVRSNNNRFNTSIIVENYNTRILMDIPLSSSNRDSYVNTLSSFISNAVSNPTAKGLASNVLTSAVDIALAKDNISNISASSNVFGTLACKQAYLILQRVDTQIPSSYKSNFGLPLHSTQKLSSLKGYTKMEDIYINFEDITKEQADEIKRICIEDGIYL